jgi:outer membrane receptor for ferric coprogen and ferric-rhodotorulic acid
VEPVFVNPNNDVMASFDYYFRQADLTNLGANAPIGSVDELRTTLFSTADGYLSDRVSKGYEFEMVGNPTRNWSIRANYSYTDRQRTNVLSEGEGWWAARVELWQSLDSLYTTRTGLPSIYNQLVFSRTNVLTNQTVAQRIADSDRELAATRFREEQGYGNRKHKANVWTRYVLSDGKCKGLTFGGGWRYQSENVAGINVASRTVYMGNARSLFDGMLAYRTKGFLGRYGDRLGVTYQLNVTNLLDDRTINILKINTDTVTGRPYIVQMIREEPRNATLTVRFAF